MKLYWTPKTRAQRGLWMIEEAGVDYELQQVDIRAADRRDDAEFLRASPMGKVPALIDGDVALAESAAICLYIADRYAPGRLAPALDDSRRGSFLYWLMYTPAVIEPAMSDKFNNVEANRVRSGWGDFELMITVFDEFLEGRDWVLGEQFSAADVMLGSSAIFMRMFNMLPETVNIADYADRCMSRPAYRRALAAEDS
jgi:glutathione S-transferase